MRAVFTRTPHDPLPDHFGTLDWEDTDMPTRTQKRSRSGAAEPCDICGKKLSGRKGLKMHMAEAHPPTPSPLDNSLTAAVAAAILPAGEQP